MIGVFFESFSSLFSLCLPFLCCYEKKGEKEQRSLENKQEEKKKKHNNKEKMSKTKTSSSSSTSEECEDGHYLDNKGFRFETLQALNDVYEMISGPAQIDEDGFPLIEEDWELSQFWYDKPTGDRVIEYIKDYVNSIENCKVGCLSTPSLYRVYLRNKEKVPNAEFVLFEYDTRFQMQGINFEFYDYNKPLMIKEKHEKQFHLLLCDPPFLSDECSEKVAKSIQFLRNEEHFVLIYLTGELAEPYITKYHPSIKLTDIQINHERNLENSFGLFSTEHPLKSISN